MNNDGTEERHHSSLPRSLSSSVSLISSKSQEVPLGWEIHLHHIMRHYSSLGCNSFSISFFFTPHLLVLLNDLDRKDRSQLGVVLSPLSSLQCIIVC